MNKDVTEKLAHLRGQRILHRGGNHLHKTRAAIKGGLEAIEADLWFYKGQVVARHSRSLGPLPILYDKYSVLPDLATPTLEKFARVAAHKVRLFLDLKSGGTEFCLRVLEVLRRRGIVSSTSVSSQDWQALELLESMEPSLPLYFSVERPDQWQAYSRLHDTRFVSGISVHHTWLTPETIAELQGRGVRVNAWTVDDPRRAVELLEWGVDGIISNSMPLLSAMGASALSPMRQMQS